MEELTTKEYNELYKKYFKEIFNKPMKDFGYKKKGTGRFCKINKIGSIQTLKRMLILFTSLVTTNNCIMLTINFNYLSRAIVLV